MKKFTKINLIILIILCLLYSYVFINPVYAEEFGVEENLNLEVEIVEENILLEESQETEKIENEEEKDLDSLKMEKSQIESEIEASNTQIGFIQEELSSVVVEVAEITQQICDKQLEIDTLIAEEKQLIEYIEKAEKELEKSNIRYEKQKKLLEKRLVSMYEKGETTYLEVLLNSKGLTEFLSNWYIISEIAESDKDLLENVEAEKKYNKKIKENLDMQKSVLTVSREKIEKESIALSNMMIIKDKKVKDLTSEELALQQMIEEYQSQVQQIETEIRKLAIANVSEEYVGGVMAWPVPGYTRITSQFGMRTHPITGVYKLHTGTDIGAPMGSSFVAANDGLVTYAGYNGAYGNMVIVDHGGGITTLYAHGSEILVSVGDAVFQGTPILKVGSTGYSTGPHAHFEVRINGEYVEPLDYITSYNDNANDTQTEIAQEEISQQEVENKIVVEFESNEENT